MFIVGQRARLVYVALALSTIAIGLLVHFVSALWRDALGDALWAAMMTWWISAFVPRARLVARGAVAYAICVGVEVSQLYHAPAIDALRATRIGHLVLGSGFDGRDFLAYGVGVVSAMFLELAARTLRRVS